MRNVVGKIGCWRVRSWKTINRKFECQLSNFNEKFPTSYFRRSYWTFLISRFFQIDSPTFNRIVPIGIHVVGKDSWKKEVGKLRKFEMKLNRNFLTSNFSTQNFPTSRFFQLHFPTTCIPAFAIFVTEQSKVHWFIYSKLSESYPNSLCGFKMTKMINSFQKLI